MTTGHAFAVSEAFETALAAEPSLSALCVDVVRKMRAGFWSQWYVDFVVQRWYGSELTLEDAWVFLKLHTAITVGEIATARIRVGEPPVEDYQLEINRAALQHLPKPFAATVTCARGRGADDDGQLSWGEAISLQKLEHDARLCEQQHGAVSTDLCCARRMFCAPSDSVPLEIGTTASSKTFTHLLFSRGVARWAYNDDHITLAYRTGTWPAVNLLKRK